MRAFESSRPRSSLRRSRVGIFATHLQRDRPAFNAVWKQTFGDHRPARSAVEVAAFGRPAERSRFMVEVSTRIRA